MSTGVRQSLQQSCATLAGSWAPYARASSILRGLDWVLCRNSVDFLIFMVARLFEKLRTSCWMTCRANLTRYAFLISQMFLSVLRDLSFWNAFDLLCFLNFSALWEKPVWCSECRFISGTSCSTCRCVLLGGLAWCGVAGFIFEGTFNVSFAIQQTLRTESSDHFS